MDNLKTRIVNSYNDLSADADSFSESSGKSRTVVEPVLRLLRKALLLDISGGEKRVPDADEIKDWVLKLFAKNPTVGDMVRALLLIKEDLVVSEHQLPSIEEALREIGLLEQLHLPDFFFVSSELEGEPCGVLFERYESDGEVLVFLATLFDKKNLMQKVGRMAIRVSKESPEPFLSICTPDGWLRVPKNQIVPGSVSSFTVQCLLEYKYYIYPTLPLSSIIAPELTRRKDNIHLVSLIKEAYLDKVVCTRVRVPLDVVQPRDIDYALHTPDEQIRDCMPYAAHTEFLLYEEDGVLIMDDDYTPYLACQALRVKEVTAVILGKFNQSRAKVLSIGYSELMSPISVSPSAHQSQKRLRDKQELLKKKLQSLRPSFLPAAKMERSFIELCWLLNRVKTRERDLHRFLKENYQILDSHLAAIFSEVPIGKYRADLVLQYHQSDKRVVLVELEPHDKKIFTKKNRLRHQVIHALQQVEDWIQEIHRGVPNIPGWLQGSYTAEGMIVIGRSKDLTEEQRETLALKNAKSSIKILTYDDLLERLSRLIKTLDKE
ncbi:DUF4263 domain-containing protein [Pseudomonas aeruginosa]